MSRFAHLAFTPAVKAAQTEHGSRATYARMEAAEEGPALLGDDELTFLAARDSFYMASIGETGWPYIQHRGGPKGFVRALDAQTIGFADYRGNRQYVSVGNVSRDDRVALIFVDYPARTRLKILARASIVTEGELVGRLTVPGLNARVERAFVLRVEAFDWNCPQHITPRFTEEEVRQSTKPLLEKLEELERENRTLRARLAAG